MKARLFTIAAFWIASLFVAYWLRPASSWASRDALQDSSNSPAAARVGAADKNPKIIGHDTPDLTAVITGSEGPLQKSKRLTSHRDLLRTFGPLLDWTPAEIQAALAQIEASPWPFQQKKEWYEYLLLRWGEMDGVAALAFVERLSDPDARPFKYDLAQSVLTSWILWAPDEAWRVVQPVVTRFPEDKSVASPLVALSAQDLPKALQFLETLQAGRVQALALVADAIGPEGSRRRMLEYAESLAPGERAKLHQILLNRWITIDSSAAMAWIETRPKEEQPLLRSHVGSTLLSFQPEIGASLAVANCEREQLRGVYAGIAVYWPIEEFSQLEKWLAAQPEGPDLDGARGAYAARIRDVDPAKAMSYAKAMQEGEYRVQSIAYVYNAWLQRDRPTAEAAMTADGLTEKQIIEQQRETFGN